MLINNTLGLTIVLSFHTLESCDTPYDFKTYSISKGIKSMTEQQANKIISLLEDISSKLNDVPNINYNTMGSESTLDDIKKLISDNSKDKL
jgi:hypothetical protein